MPGKWRDFPEIVGKGWLGDAEARGLGAEGRGKGAIGLLENDTFMQFSRGFTSSLAIRGALFHTSTTNA